MQRLNVTNTNGVHFPKVSGNQELLALNCGEHKPPSLCSNESNRSEARALVASPHGRQQKNNPAVPTKQSSNPRRQPRLLLGLWQQSHTSRPPYRTRRRRRRQHREPSALMQNMQQQTRSNLCKQQDRPTPTSTKPSPKRTAKRNTKTNFFGGRIHPEQAFTQDNAESG